MKFKLSNNIVVLFVLMTVIFGCGGMNNFVVMKTVNADSVGFVSDDILQVVGSGYAGLSTVDPKEKITQAKMAAIIKAKMNVVDFLQSKLKDEGDKYYVSFVTLIGEFLSNRYDPIYGKALLDGDARVDGIFNLLNLKGYIYKVDYDAEKGFCKITYRLVKAGLMEKAKRGFSE